jgi:hypothetical protein
MATVGKPRYNLAKQNERENLKRCCRTTKDPAGTRFGLFMQRIVILDENRAAQSASDKVTWSVSHHVDGNLNRECPGSRYSLSLSSHRAELNFFPMGYQTVRGALSMSISIVPPRFGVTRDGLGVCARVFVTKQHAIGTRNGSNGIKQSIM